MPKIVDHDAERLAIASACTELFARKGYNGVTMRSIADEVGVSTGKLYHYFPDKKSIFISLFEAASSADLAEITSGVDHDTSVATRLATLIEFANTHRDHLTRLLLLAIDVHRELPPDEAADASRQVAEAYRSAIGTLLGADAEWVEVSFSFIAGALISMMLDPNVDPLKLAEKLPVLAQAM